MFWQPTRGILQPNQHWRRGQDPGTSPTTVYGPSSFTTATTGWNDFTFIHRLTAADMLPGTGTQMRITTVFSSWTSGGTMIGYMGQAAAAGDAYDFLNTPAQILWGGLTSVTSTGSNLTNVSDFVTLPEAYDEAKVYLFAFYFSNVTTVNLANTGAAIAGGSHYKAGNDASTVNKTGYSSWQNNISSFVQTVEVQ